MSDDLIEWVEINGIRYACQQEVAHEILDLRKRLEAAEKDAERYRWLTEDHADRETRTKCREILDRMATMSYGAACEAIHVARVDAALRAVSKAAIKAAWCPGDGCPGCEYCQPSAALAQRLKEQGTSPDEGSGG